MIIKSEDLTKFAEIYEEAENYASTLVCIRYGSGSYIENLVYDEGTFEAEAYTYGSGCGGDKYHGTIWFYHDVLEDPEASLHKEKEKRDNKTF